MNHSTKKLVDIEKELTMLGKQEVPLPKDLSTITLNKIHQRNEKESKAIPWILGFTLAFSSILTMTSILGIRLSMILNLYQWLIVLTVSITVEVVILAVFLIFKDPIIKELSTYS